MADYRCEMVVNVGADGNLIWKLRNKGIHNDKHCQWVNPLLSGFNSCTLAHGKKERKGLIMSALSASTIRRRWGEEEEKEKEKEMAKFFFVFQAFISNHRFIGWERGGWERLRKREGGISNSIYPSLMKRVKKRRQRIWNAKEVFQNIPFWLVFSLSIDYWF